MKLFDRDSAAAAGDLMAAAGHCHLLVYNKLMPWEHAALLEMPPDDGPRPD